MFHVPEEDRVIAGPFASNYEHGCNGVFMLNGLPGRPGLVCIASDGEGWEHVSVSYGAGKSKTPSWAEMCYVKEKFWDKEDVVVQFHPAESEYVNFHPGCLHLWRPRYVGIPTPPREMVGPK